MIARNVIKKEQVVSIFRSQRFPTTGYGYVYTLKPELAAKVKEAFFTYNWDGTDLLKEFATSQPPGEAFVPITYKEHWQIVRDVDKAMSVSYSCKG